MGFYAIDWARTAPVANPSQRAILMELAFRSKADGTSAYPSKSTLAEVAVCSKKTVIRHIAGLLELGIIKEGDQAAASEIDPRYRPVVYDLQIPFTWFSADQLKNVNQERRREGRGPLTPRERPPVTPAAGVSELHPSPADPVEPDTQGCKSDPAEGGQPDTPEPDPGVSNTTAQGCKSDPRVRKDNKNYKTEPNGSGRGAATPRDDGGLFPAEPAPDPSPVRELVARWIDRCNKRPPTQTVARVGKHIRELVEDGIDAADIWRGLCQWQDKGLSPAAIHAEVNAVMNGQPQLRAVAGNPATPASRAAAWMALDLTPGTTGPQEIPR